jgi:hypothetical protein
MMHCHNLVHEDHDMMVQFEVGTGGPNPWGPDPVDLTKKPPMSAEASTPLGADKC